MGSITETRVWPSAYACCIETAIVLELGSAEKSRIISIYIAIRTIAGGGKPDAVSRTVVEPTHLIPSRAHTGIKVLRGAWPTVRHRAVVIDPHVKLEPVITDEVSVGGRHTQPVKLQDGIATAHAHSQSAVIGCARSFGNPKRTVVPVEFDEIGGWIGQIKHPLIVAVDSVEIITEQQSPRWILIINDQCRSGTGRSDDITSAISDGDDREFVAFVGLVIYWRQRNAARY